MPTKHLIPRASGEGGLGIPDITWGQAYYDTGNFNKGLFVSGKNIDEVIADAVTGGGLGGVWDTAPGGIIYYNGGNVGIGTASPSASLEVHSGNTNTVAQFVSTDAGANIAFKDNTTSTDNGLGTTAIGATSDNLIMYTNNGEKMRIDSAGNVGIGTTSPNSVLEVQGKQGYANSADSLITSTTKSTLRVKGSEDSSDSLWMGVEKTDATPYIQGSNGNGDNAKNILINPFGGNVGIGTTSPIAPLHIQSASSNTIDLTRGINVSNIAVGAASKIRGGALAGTNPSMGSAIGFALVDSDGTGPGTSTEGYMYLETKNSGGSLTEKMRIDSAGNVGIGTTSPSAKLEIEGLQSILTLKSTAGQRFCQSDWSSGSLSGYNGYITVDSGPNGDGTIQKFVIGITDAWVSDGFQGISIRCASSIVDSFIFKPNGNLYGQNWLPGGTISINSSGEIVTTSDKRLKNDLGDCEYGLNEVLQLKPKKYTWKDGPKHQESTIGFFAQDLHAVMEEAGPRKVKLDDKGNPVTDEDGEPDYDWGMNSNAIIAALVNSTKEQQQLIEDLRSEVEALKNK